MMEPISCLRWIWKSCHGFFKYKTFYTEMKIFFFLSSIYKTNKHFKIWKLRFRPVLGRLIKPWILLLWSFDILFIDTRRIHIFYFYYLFIIIFNIKNKIKYFIIYILYYQYKLITHFNRYKYTLENTFFYCICD